LIAIFFYTSFFLLPHIPFKNFIVLQSAINVPIVDTHAFSMHGISKDPSPIIPSLLRKFEKGTRMNKSAVLFILAG
jgi:hypothetical protein